MRTLLTHHYDSVATAGWPPLRRYGLAVVSTGAAFVLTALLPELGAHTPFLLYVVAVAAACFYGGFGPGALAAVLGLLLAPGWQGAPGNVLPLANPFPLHTAGFILISITLLIFNYALRRSRTRLGTERDSLHLALAAAADSEERFRAAQELSPDAFAILAAVRDTAGQVVDFRLQYVNPAAVKIAGTTRAQIEGKLMSEVFPGTMTNSDMFERYIKVIETEQPHDLEIPYDAEGIHGWFRNMAVKLGDGVAISFFDITERKRHEAELSYQAFLLANMSDAVFVVDLDRRITHWNHGAEVLYGWQAAEVIGQLAPDVLRTEASTETIAERLAGVAEGTQNHFQAVHYSRSGELLYVASTATAIRNNGVLTGYLIINRNVTERIRHEQELQQLNATLEKLNATLEQRVRERTAELERSNRELDQFAFVASHDLKAPLRAIALLAEWITEDSGPTLSAKSRTHLDKLNGRVKRMERLLDDLLAYSRAGRALQPPEQVDTGLLVQETVDLLNLPPGFQVLLPPDMPGLITERVPLATVFRNLIQNACKHHDHPDRGCVTVTVADLGDAFEFTVADDGPGIAPEYHDQVFELFRTLKPRDQVEGSGMGLSVVKKTVESRGGAIHLTSSPGQGAAFTFTWPRVS